MPPPDNTHTHTHGINTHRAYRPTHPAYTHMTHKQIFLKKCITIRIEARILFVFLDLKKRGVEESGGGDANSTRCSQAVYQVTGLYVGREGVQFRRGKRPLALCKSTTKNTRKHEATLSIDCS